MRRVVLESPFAADGDDEEAIKKKQAHNVRYAIACMKDCLARHEAPIASHLLYPQVLNDHHPIERHLGILAGQVWGVHAELVVAYTDLGISNGMKASLAMYEAAAIPIEYRQLPGWTP